MITGSGPRSGPGIGHEHDQVGSVTAYAADLDRQPELVAAARSDLAGVNVGLLVPPGRACPTATCWCWWPSASHRRGRAR
ncbi:hypothetical protein [Micromonospora sp. NPDC005413]|uniref:hypothetical protein n=1 Tax=Micromonospora sp. NPDC005413 TaxID=3154563 RepID=UPI0033AB3CFD